MRPLVEIRLADLERLARESPPPGAACSLTSCSSAAARAAVVRTRVARRRSGARRRARPRRAGSTSTPASGGTNSGGPPTRVATTLRAARERFERAWPNGSTRLGWQRTSARGEVARHRVVRHVAGDASRPAGPRAARAAAPSPTNVSVPSPSRANASASRTTFLRSISEPTQTNAGPGAAGALGAARKRSRSTPQSTTSVLPRASGTAASSSRAQPVARRRSRCARAADDATR